jgi:flagellar biogenesis protein FliO
MSFKNFMGLVQQSAAITLVLVLLWIVLWWLKRKGLAAVTGHLRLKNPDRELEVQQRLPLTPHHSLQLIRVRERSLLVAVHPGGLTVICEMEAHRP